MAIIEIRADKLIAAEPSRVWELLADHEGLSRWQNFNRVVRRRPGVPDPNGVGAVRTLYGSRGVMEERIIAFEPMQRLEYEVLKGAPGSNARGKITISPTGDGGTLVWWRVTMIPYIPGTGWAIKAFLSSALDKSLQRLKERLEPERPASYYEPAPAQPPSHTHSESGYEGATCPVAH